MEGRFLSNNFSDLADQVAWPLDQFILFSKWFCTLESLSYIKVPKKEKEKEEGNLNTTSYNGKRTFLSINLSKESLTV